jgi:molybdate/tungstate transport system ATP-binding protein
MLELDGITKTYGSFRLGPVDLAVGREVVAVLGPSGCGKTTLLSVVAGIVAPDAGAVRLGEERIDGTSLEERGTACVFQDSAVFPHLTARANVAYAAADPSVVDDLAETFEIAGVLDQRAETLSGGERRRVEVARALAARPRVLLLDEPTTGLDAPIRRRLRSQLRDVLQGLDVPVLYVTHDQDEAAVVADRIAVMNDGTLLQVAPPADVFHRPADPFTAAFTGNPNVFSARVDRAPPGDGSGTEVVWRGRSLRVAANGFAAGNAVWLCIRPEEVALDVSPERRDGDEAGDGTSNVFEAVVDRQTYEGGLHVLTLRLPGEAPSDSTADPVTLEARMLPSVARRLDLAPGTILPVRLPEDALHLIPKG